MLQTGDILLVRGSAPIISSAIRWFTGSEYTHVALVISEDYVYEIDINKSLSIRPNHYNPKDYDVFRPMNSLTNKQCFMIKAHAFCQMSKNKGYDWLRILSFACQKLFNTRKAFHDANRMICSELVDEVYGMLGIDLVPDKETGNVVPGDFSQSSYLFQVFGQ